MKPEDREKYERTLELRKTGNNYGMCIYVDVRTHKGN